MDNVELLMSFGLTRQEARVYILLLGEGALSGYEAAKRLGISRSNAYAALAGLVDKGAAYVAEEQAVQYHAVSIKEFCSNKLHYMEELSEILERQIPKQKQEDAKYLTIRGRRHIEDKFRNMLKEVKERVYLSVSASVADLFREELAELTAQNKKVVLLTDEQYILDGAIIYYAGKRSFASENTGCEETVDGQIRLITDSSYALTGELQDEETSACLYSANPNLVRLLKDALANEIKLIEIEGKSKDIDKEG
nr:helix-turn-helix domain-containing protein [uncultured Anaerobutyricum sp.]